MPGISNIYYNNIDKQEITYKSKVLEILNNVTTK